jgi:DnaD/phage-associated family protein
MPERGFNTELWNDPFIQELPPEGKLLYIYLWTNAHCNQAGLYEITSTTIAFETKLPAADIPKFLELLKPKVVWYPDSNLVWVKNFIKRQTKSPKFLIAVAKSLSFIHHNGAIQELIEYNYNIHSISIPYPYSSSGSGGGSVLLFHLNEKVKKVDFKEEVNLKLKRYGIDTVPIPSSASASADLDLLSKANKEEVNSLVLSYKGEEDKNLAKWFHLYQQNIGALFPLIAERLNELSAIYLVEWFEEAVREAVKAEHRNLKYIEAILGRWKTEGFKTPKTSKHPGKKEDDPDKYIKGKYGHLVVR